MRCQTQCGTCTCERPQAALHAVRVASMKHLNILWNPATKEWSCAKCGHTSDHATVEAAHVELDQYECEISSEGPIAAVGTETTRLIKKLFNMTVRKERGGCRFTVAQIGEGKPVIQLELFHDAVPELSSLSVGFEVLSGVTLEQVRILVNAMNEKIVGIIIGSK